MSNLHTAVQQLYRSLYHCASAAKNVSKLSVMFSGNRIPLTVKDTLVCAAGLGENTRGQFWQSL